MAPAAGDHAEENVMRVALYPGATVVLVNNIYEHTYGRQSGQDVHDPAASVKVAR